MPLFGLFGPPNVERLKRSGDMKGLSKALHYQKDPSIRKAALEAIDEVRKAPRDICAMMIIEGLKDQDPEVRETAARVIHESYYGGMTDALWNFYRWERDPETRRIAAQVLQSKNPFMMLFKKLWQNDTGHNLVIDALSFMNPGGVAEGLFRAYENLSDDNWQKNHEEADPRIASVLAQFADTSFLESKAKTGKAHSYTLAMAALGKKGDQAAFDVLLNTIQDEQADKWGARIPAIGGIAASHDSRFVDLLTTIVRQHPDDELRYAAAVGLKSLGQEGIDSLLTALTDQDERIRNMAAGSLAGVDARHRNYSGKAGPANPDVIRGLRQAMKDPNSGVRNSAARGLRAMNCPPEDAEERVTRAVESLDLNEMRSLGKVVLEPLLEAMSAAGFWFVPSEMIDTLVEIGGKDAVPLLIGITRYNDRDAEHACYALTKVVERFLDQLTTEVLRDITCLQDRVTYEGDLDHYEKGVYAANLRKLALEELKRRETEQLKRWETNSEEHLGELGPTSDCVCPHCGIQIDKAPSWPRRGNQLPFYAQTDLKRSGSYHVKLNCAACGKLLYIVWDYDPRLG